MDNKEFKKVLEQFHINFLKEGYAVWVETSGKSMEPVIREGDFLKIVPLKVEEIERGEIVAFLRDKKLLIAHRLIKKEKDNLFTCGDSFIFAKDPPLKKEEVLGKVVAVRRNNKKRDLEKGFWYLYGRVITHLRSYGFPLLIILLSLYKIFTQPRISFIKAVKRICLIVHQSTRHQY